MKVCFVNIPDPNSLDPKLDPPLGLLYLHSTIKNNGFNSQIVDLSLSKKLVLEDTIPEADLYGMTVYSANMDSAYYFTYSIKELYPLAKVIWGGPQPTFCAIDIITNYPEVDFVAFGEGEETILELCEKFNRCDYSTIQGLGHRNGRSFFLANRREVITNLDNLALPYRTDLDLKAYTRKVDGKPSTPIMTARGCAYNCRFCCSKYFWHYPRFHSVKRVLRELAHIYLMGFDAFHCWDDTFTLHPKRLSKILARIKHFEMVFRCNGDLRLDTKATLQKLYDGGCREYGVGIESGDQHVLDTINKGTTVERNKQVLKWAKEIGLPVKAYIMVGNPGETWESVQKTIDFVKETGPEYYTLSNFVPLPGCDFYHHSDKYGIKFRTKDWSEYYVIGRQNEGGCVIDTPTMTAEEIGDARKLILQNLPKQKGKLQDYYEKLVKK